MSDSRDHSVQPSGTLSTAWRLLARYGRGEVGWIAFGLGLMLASTLASLLAPWPVKLVLDGVLADHRLPLRLDDLAAAISSSNPRLVLLILLCLGQLLVHLLMGALTVWSTYLLVAIGLKMVFRLRCDLFDHVQRLSLKFHDSTSVGDSLYRVTWDSYAVQALFNSGLIPTISSVVTLVGIAAVMFTRDWMIALVALAVGIPLLLFVRWLDRPMTHHSMQARERESEISTRVEQTLTGIRAVQAFGRESFESERFRAEAQSSLKANLRLTVLQTASGSAVSLMLAAGTAVIVGISAWRVMQGRMNVGDVWLMIAYVGMLFKPLETLAYTAAAVQGSVAGAHRVFALLDRPSEVADASDAVELPGRAAGALQFEGVWFEYKPNQPVLRDVSLDIAPGQTVALVGPSGAGKTTLVSLILRFYDPIRGRVLVDGKDLRSLTLASLRRNVALVLQEPVLFAASIGENIAYGLPGATSVQVEAAARSAGAHEFIQSLPEGYDTRIGERGVSLSGGQRQRLSIARAFLKDAPILVMDEPTSALDAQTEAALLETLEKLKAGRTTIIIAHRLSTIRQADVIVAMRDGQVVEMGSHEALLARRDLYANLYRMQFGNQEPAAVGSVR